MNRFYFILLLFFISCKQKEQAVRTLSPLDTIASVTEMTYEKTGLKGRPFGTIKGLELAYDCYGCNTASTDYIIAYAKKAASKDTLFRLDFGGYYITDITLINIEGQPFIYVDSEHTHGHSEGYLYALDTDKIMAHRVRAQKSNFKIPDSLYLRNFFGLVRNENNTFGFGGTLRSEKTGENYVYSGDYKWISKAKTGYILEPYNETITK